MYQYRHFDAFKAICATLTRLGYSYDYWHLNSADYGVPQTRKRLILLARRGVHVIQRPATTHCEGGDWFSTSWVGWYEAIEDLIPGLPESAFAPWQLPRLPEEINQTVLLSNLKDTFNACATVRTVGAGAPTVRTGYRPSWIDKAFIIGGGNTNKTIIDSKARFADEPMFTVTATDSARKSARAWVIDQVNSTSMTIRSSDEPIFTVSCYSPKHQAPRAWLQRGRVVAMTPRALARFQSFSDSYWLPDRAQSACTVIGNAVPPLFMQRVMESL